MHAKRSDEWLKNRGRSSGPARVYVLEIVNVASKWTIIR